MIYKIFLLKVVRAIFSSFCLLAAISCATAPPAGPEPPPSPPPVEVPAAKPEETPQGPLCQTLTVNIQGFRNTKGTARIALFLKPEGFPQEPKAAAYTTVAKIEQGTARVVFRDIPYATYALSALHDENNDGRMNRSRVGIPLEGFCVSNQMASVLKPPEFKQATFILRVPKRRMTLRLKYLLR